MFEDTVYKMNRGYFNNVINNAAYQNACKQWNVELIRSDIFWYELIVNNNNDFDTKGMISEALKELKTIVENELDKRFIYFIASRKRLRFSLRHRPKYSLLTNKLILYIEVGRKKKIKRISTHVLDIRTGKVIKPKVKISDRFITFLHADGNKFTYSIHDLLLNSNIELGFCTEVHYVGFTKNPQKRPIDGSHSGLSNILYRISTEDNDIFVCYNLFKVLTVGANDRYGLNFVVANSMTDEIQVDLEGLIIEKCFILYFNALFQDKNRENERKELENSLGKLAEDNKIESVTIRYEIEHPCEYYRFGSSSVKPKDCHLFTCRFNDGCLLIEEGSSYYDDFIQNRVSIFSSGLGSLAAEKCVGPPNNYKCTLENSMISVLLYIHDTIV